MLQFETDSEIEVIWIKSSVDARGKFGPLIIFSVLSITGFTMAVNS